MFRISVQEKLTNQAKLYYGMIFLQLKKSEYFCQPFWLFYKSFETFLSLINIIVQNKCRLASQSLNINSAQTVNLIKAGYKYNLHTGMTSVFIYN